MAANPNSILDSTKKVLGIDADSDDFDIDVIMHINSFFSVLNQIGVGPEDGFEIQDRTAMWVSYLGANKIINNVKTAMFLQVRLWFDPPTLSFDLTAKQEQLKEQIWRLQVADDKTLFVRPIIVVEYEDLDTVIL